MWLEKNCVLSGVWLTVRISPRRMLFIIVCQHYGKRVGSRSSATSSNPASTISVPPQDTSDMISPVTSRIGGGCTSTNSLESAANCRRKNISAIHGSTHCNSCCSLLTVSLSDQLPACTQLRSSVSCYSALQSRLTRAYRMLNPTLSGPTCSQAAIALQRTPARH